MAATKRTPIQREHDLTQIAGLYLRGKTQAAIAEELKITQQQVSYDLKIIQARWRKDTTIDMDEAKRKELARIDELERTYWTAWERSLDEKVKTRTEKRAGEEGGKASIEKETLLGVPAYLAGVQWCISERCKLLGLYAPAKSALTDAEGNAIPIVVVRPGYLGNLK
jgi:hypothetical protein